MLLTACSLIYCGNINDTVSIDIENNLDLRNTTSCGKDSVKSELSEELVVTCELTLTLCNTDINRALVILCR